MPRPNVTDGKIQNHRFLLAPDAVRCREDFSGIRVRGVLACVEIALELSVATPERAAPTRWSGRPSTPRIAARALSHDEILLNNCRRIMPPCVRCNATPYRHTLAKTYLKPPPPPRHHTHTRTHTLSRARHGSVLTDVPAGRRVFLTENRAGFSEGVL